MVQRKWSTSSLWCPTSVSSWTSTANTSADFHCRSLRRFVSYYWHIFTTFEFQTSFRCLQQETNILLACKKCENLSPIENEQISYFLGTLWGGVYETFWVGLHHCYYLNHLSSLWIWKGSVRSVAFFMLDKVSAPELIAATVQSCILPYTEEHDIPFDELLLQYIKVKTPPLLQSPDTQNQH